MLYIPDSRADTEALNSAADRGSVRRVAHGIYTDDLDRPLEIIVAESVLAIIGRVYPGWYVSYSTAATLRPVDGIAFISGRGSRRSTRLPGVVIKRLPALPHPETLTLALDTLVASRLRSEPARASVQVSSPLQVVLEALSHDARQPQRSLPDEAVRTLIDALPEEDVARAEAFATRNGLPAELARFIKLRTGLEQARKHPLRRAEGLDLYFYNWRVGRLEALPHGEFRFRYDPDWAIGLSGLPRDRSPAFEGRALPPFLDNLLPEGWAEARLCAAYKIAREDTFGLLKTTQKYLSNLTLRPDGFEASGLVLDQPGVRLRDLASDPDVLEVTESIGRDPDSTELWIELRRRSATRLSGVQPKLPVRLDLSGGHVTVTLGDLTTPTTHILKLPSPESPQVAENEWAIMELARRIGQPVPTVRRVAFQEGSLLRWPALLVERFDLPPSLEQPTELLLLEDAASLIGISRDQKYDPSHEKVFDALRSSGVPEEDFAAYFDHVAYSWLVGNGDLHAKNISVVHHIAPGRLGSPPLKTGVRYASWYDLVCTRLVIRDDLFALTLNGRRNKLRAGDFVALAQRWGWTRAEAVTRLKRLTEQVGDTIEDVVRLSGLAKDRQDHAIRLVAANTELLLGSTTRA